MNERIRELLDRMTALEDELRTALHEQEDRLSYRIQDKRIEFERSVREAHLRVKTGLFRWLVQYRPLNLITGPIIYGMILPLILLDFCVSVYQYTCFPIYRIARVKRVDYFVYDRRHLAYLNIIEKFHCSYCAYANGLLGYATEIVARTELYFCPIKHARKRLGQHGLYRRFISYGDAADYAERLEQYRQSLERKQP